ncbi:DUF3274 domain-containing protein [Dyella flava]|uniref:DUF3274 domain-containing protein n=1 Tax=Dyella flava TaxID=1920170 RepID=A0ABS2K1U7_9GAMM|nr:DUF3274 domain-containing protein [Dyella flava]MBM7125220.1 DUF3274 domain-containing protein [Dyella flava]GLQ50737.1 hypothetical protein GCM10010872_21860 [Dyella flava]
MSDHGDTNDTRGTGNAADTPADDAGTVPPRHRHDEPTRVVPAQRDVHGNPYWTSYQTPNSYKVRAEVQLPPHLPGIIIFVHGVNSEGEWYDDAEQALCDGLNDRLNRTDLTPNGYLTSDSNAEQTVARQTDPKVEGRSPVIRFYWGYRAPDGQEKNWSIPLRNEEGADCWNPQRAEHAGPWYWGGGPFQNGTNNLLQLWSKEGMKQRVFGFFDIQSLNDLWDRDLENAPSRQYYAHAAHRLAKLVDRIREENPRDTVTIMSHSQGTMIAMAATLLCTRRAPDAVIVMNSPYAMKDRLIDKVTCGDQRQTTAARVNTLKAVAARLKQDQKVFTENELKQLQCGATQDRHLWQPNTMLKNGVPERDNHGRLYVYFNPHDRVMGTSPLQSIGWQGVDDNVLAQLGDNVKQRMLARGTPCGDEPGVRKFGTLPPIPDPAPSVKATDFWNGNDATMGSDLWTVPNVNQIVTINAEKVPEPITAHFMSQPVEIRQFRQADGTPKDVVMYFDQSRSSQYLWGGRDKTGKYYEPSFPYFASVYQPRWVWDNRMSPFAGRTTRMETVDELHKRLESYQPWPTNHSTLPKHAKFMRQVVAYDVPIGFCDSYESFDFWRELMVSADWTQQGRGLNTYCQDTYFTACQLDVPAIPLEIDPETVEEAEEKQEAAELSRQTYGRGLQ